MEKIMDEFGKKITCGQRKKIVVGETSRTSDSLDFLN